MSTITIQCYTRVAFAMAFSCYSWLLLVTLRSETYIKESAGVFNLSVIELSDWQLYRLQTFVTCTLSLIIGSFQSPLVDSVLCSDRGGHAMHMYHNCHRVGSDNAVNEYS